MEGKQLGHKINKDLQSRSSWEGQTVTFALAPYFGEGPGVGAGESPISALTGPGTQDPGPRPGTRRGLGDFQPWGHHLPRGRTLS